MEQDSMRLLYLANAASVHTRKWVNYFAEEGHEVHLVTWHKPGITWEPGGPWVHSLLMGKDDSSWPKCRENEGRLVRDSIDATKSHSGQNRTA